jgi:hypothetical protein
VAHARQELTFSLVGSGFLPARLFQGSDINKCFDDAFLPVNNNRNLFFQNGYFMALV